MIRWPTWEVLQPLCFRRVAVTHVVSLDGPRVQSFFSSSRRPLPGPLASLHSWPLGRSRGPAPPPWPADRPRRERPRQPPQVGANAEISYFLIFFDRSFGVASTVVLATSNILFHALSGQDAEVTFQVCTPGVRGRPSARLTAIEVKLVTVIPSSNPGVKPISTSSAAPPGSFTGSSELSTS